MKSLKGIFLICILILSAGALYGQVKVTGHVSAEVVESIVAENGFSGNISLNSNQKNVDLGSIRLTGPAQATYDVSVAQAAIYNDNARYTMLAGVEEKQADRPNTKDISLTALINDKIEDGDYSGDLTVIISYN